MGEEMVDQLRNCRLFSGMSDRTLRSIAKSMRRTEHSAGKYVMEEGHTPLGMHVIVDGEATVELHGENRRALKPGDYFGIVSAIDGKPRSASVKAETNLVTLGITPWEFRPLWQEQPQVAEELLVALCELLRSVEQGSTPQT